MGLTSTWTDRPTFTITTPASVGPNAPAAGAGDIENPGDVDIYTVSNAAPAERLFVAPGVVTPDQARAQLRLVPLGDQGRRRQRARQQQLLLRHHRRPGDADRLRPLHDRGDGLQRHHRQLPDAGARAGPAALHDRRRRGRLTRRAGRRRGPHPGPGDSDLFTLSGVNSGDSVFITPTTATPDQDERGCSYFAWILRDGAGAAIASRPTSAARAGRSRSTGSGPYTLEV